MPAPSLPAPMPLFVGYATLEKWLDTRSPRLPAYVLAVLEAGQDQGGLSRDVVFPKYADKYLI